MAWQQDSSTSISIRVYTRERHRREAPEKGTRKSHQRGTRGQVYPSYQASFCLFFGFFGARLDLSPNTHSHTHTRARHSLFWRAT